MGHRFPSLPCGSLTTNNTNPPFCAMPDLLGGGRLSLLSLAFASFPPLPFLLSSTRSKVNFLTLQGFAYLLILRTTASLFQRAFFSTPTFAIYPKGNIPQFFSEPSFLELLAC